MCRPSHLRLLFVSLALVMIALFGGSGTARGQKAAEKPAEPPPAAAAKPPAAAPAPTPTAAAPAPAAKPQAAAPASPPPPVAAPAPTPAAAATPPASTTPKTAPAQPEPRLRFQFRFQRWADVLEWFAREADLSLVLDAPPPGTFNYSDTREYTPAEAIDLLNGVLQTKGYTLIRRGRMLLVVNLKAGLPEGVVPQITLDELDSRGKFELVTVRFPIGHRDMTTVVKEITPLLGTYGKIVPLPASAVVQVTESAGIMRSVKVLIQSIAEPAAAAAGEALVLAHYPIKPADPQAVLTTFKALFPTTKMAYDESGDQLHVLASPSEQAMAKKLMEDMRSGNPAEKQSRLELYAVSEGLGPQVLSVLKTILPKAIFALDPKTGKIAAWGPAADHEAIKQTIAKLGDEAAKGGGAGLEVYRLAGVDPASTLLLLQSTLPEAKLSLDTASASLLAWATPAEHKRLAATLAKLGAAAGQEGAPRLEVFKLTKANPSVTLQLLLTLAPHAKISLDSTSNSIVALANADDRKIIQETIARLQSAHAEANAQLSFHAFKQPPPADLLTVLRTAVPQATIKLDVEGKRLTIVATPDDRTFLESLLARYEKIAPAEEKNQLVLYAATPEQKTRFQAVLTTLATDLPGIKAVADAEPSQLAVWAKPEQHELLRGIFEQLRKEPPTEHKSQLVMYSLKSVDPAAALLVLTPMFPDAKLVPDKKTRKIAVWARPADQTAIKAAIEQLDGGAASHGAERMQTYVSPTADPTVAIGVLEDLLPHVRLQSDAKSNAIFAWASAADQDVIRRTLEEMRVENAPDNKPSLEVYPCDVENTLPLVTFLQSLLPTAKIVADADAHNVAVWGTKKDHETAREALSKFSGGGAGGLLETTRQVEVYPLTKADPTLTLALLKTLIPKARLAVDARTQRLIVVATLADHNVVRGTLEQLQPEKPGPTDPELQFYKLKKPAPAALVTGLQALAPAAQITLSPTGGRLMVIAPAAEQEVIKKNVERFQEAAAAEGSERLIIYPLKSGDPTTVVAALAKMFPRAEVTPDKKGRRIVVVARPEEQEAIHAAIEQLSAGQAGDSTGESLMVYPMQTDPKTVADMLQEIFPDMQFTADPKTQAVIARGTMREQQTVAGIIQRMGQSEESLRPKLATYPTGKIDPTTLRTLLAQLVPNATVTADLKTRVVLALATAKEHEAIRGAVEKLTEAESPETAPVTVSYTVRATGAAAALRLLAVALPEAEFAVGGEPSQLIAYARPSEQATIKAAIEQMESQGVPDDKRVMAVYSLPAKDAAALTLALEPATMKNVTITPLPHRGGLLVWAEPAQQKAIKKSVEQLKHELPKALEPTAKVYHFRWADPRSVLTALTGAAARGPLGGGRQRPHADCQRRAGRS